MKRNKEEEIRETIVAREKLDKDFMARKSTSYPTTRKGWRDYYIKLYNKTLDEESLHLAMWYSFLVLAHADGDIY